MFYLEGKNNKDVVIFQCILLNFFNVSKINAAERLEKNNTSLRIHKGGIFIYFYDLHAFE